MRKYNKAKDQWISLTKNKEAAYQEQRSTTYIMWTHCIIMAKNMLYKDLGNYLTGLNICVVNLHNRINENIGENVGKEWNMNV